MKQDIPAEVLNETDSDDLLVAICFGIFGNRYRRKCSKNVWSVWKSLQPRLVLNTND